MNNDKDGFFTLRSPQDLYHKCEFELVRFHESSSSYDLFNLIVSLVHLREWIWPGGAKEYPLAETKKQKMSAELSETLYKNDSYKKLKCVCNSSKHFNGNSQSKKNEFIINTDSISGSAVGLVCAGDRLGQDYYLIDGKDIRDDINCIYNLYKKYFETI